MKLRLLLPALYIIIAIAAAMDGFYMGAAFCLAIAAFMVFVILLLPNKP